jgi:hypothetical protein
METDLKRTERAAREAAISLNKSDLLALNKWKASAVRHRGYTEVRVSHTLSDHESQSLFYSGHQGGDHCAREQVPACIPRHDRCMYSST